MKQAKFNYLGLENLIEWIVYVAAVLFVWDMPACQYKGVRLVNYNLSFMFLSLFYDLHFERA